MKNMKTMTVLAFLLLGLSFVFGCAETGENADIYAAQKCLNDLSAADETNSTALNSCLNKLSGSSTSEARALECSIKLMIGGITTNAITDAFKKQDGGTSGATILSLSYSGASNNLTAAKDAEATCLQSGQQGLIGVAGMVVTGTLVCSVAAQCGPGSPPGNATDVSNALAACKASCSSAEKEALAETAVSLADNYCGDSNDSDICEDFNSSVSQYTDADGNITNASALADALMDNL